MRSTKTHNGTNRKGIVRAAVETLESRTLLSASVSKTLVALNSIAAGNSGAGPSPAQPIVVTNTGGSALTITSASIVNDPSASTQDASAFQVVSGLPGSLAPGQSATMQVRFTAGRVGVESALLQIQTNDATAPTTAVALRGLGTAGQFANLEPSLQQILNLYEIPVNDGDPTPNTTDFPGTPGLLGDEITAQRFVKAGSGPVTVQMLASFGIGTPVVERLGYYAPGSPDTRSELFSIGSADQQSVDPTTLGATSFDPGTVPFGLYAAFPHFTDPASGGQLTSHERWSFSEDALNTGWDASDPHKMRAYPLKNPDGSVVPNAYVVAFEDYNLAYDSNDLVAILRNVTPAAGPVLGVENLSQLPFADRLVFNRIQHPNATLGDIVHDTNTLRIHNTGNQPLTITKLTLSDSANWQIVNAPSLPDTIAPGGTLDLTIKFIATTNPSHTDNQTNNTATTNGVAPVDAGGVYTGTLTIASNDPSNPSRQVQLAGYWQFESEHENEPGLQTIVNKLAGYQTNINPTPIADLTEGTSPTYYGEEYTTNNGLWQAADTSRPVTVYQLATFHNQGNSASTFWYPSGSSTLTKLFATQTDVGQSLLPLINGGSTPAAGSFTPSGAFGFNLDGEYSEDSRNTADRTQFGRSGHSVRFYPLRDSNGHLVPDAWLMVQDYENGPYDNDDFQDLVYVVQNMRPTDAPATPQDLQATPSGGGTMLQWAPANGAAGYKVLRSVNGATPTALTTQISATSYVDASPPAGSIRYYVAAVDGSGHSSMLASAGIGSEVVGGQPFKVTIGAGGFKTLRFTDADGTVATLTLRGPGSATIFFNGSGLTQVVKHGVATVVGTGASISSIQATGTTGATTLTIAGHGGNKTVDVGSISTDGSFKSISANTTNLAGDLTAAGSIGQIQLASAAGGHITAASVGKINVKSDASFAINAAQIVSLIVHGNLHDSTLTLTSPPTSGFDLATLTAGSITNTTINSAGNLKNVSARSMTGSKIYAGVGALGNNPLPTAASDFTSQAAITSVKVRRGSSATFSNSDIAAATLGKIDLGTAPFANGGAKYGAAAQRITLLTAADSATGKRLTVKNVSDATTLSAQLAAEGVSPQDLVIRIV